VHQNDS